MTKGNKNPRVTSEYKLVNIDASQSYTLIELVVHIFYDMQLKQIFITIKREVLSMRIILILLESLN